MSTLCVWFALLVHLWFPVGGANSYSLGNKDLLQSSLGSKDLLQPSLGEMIDVQFHDGVPVHLTYTVPLGEGIQTPDLFLSLRYKLETKVSGDVTIRGKFTNADPPFERVWKMSHPKLDFWLEPFLVQRVEPALVYLQFDTSMVADMNVTFQMQRYLSTNDSFEGHLSSQLKWYESRVWSWKAALPRQITISRCDCGSGGVITSVWQAVPSIMIRQEEWVTDCTLAREVVMWDGLAGYYNRSKLLCPEARLVWPASSSASRIVVLVTYLPKDGRSADVMNVELRWTHQIKTPHHTVPVIQRAARDYLFTVPTLGVSSDKVSIFNREHVAARLSLDPQESGFDRYHMMSSACFLQRHSHWAECSIAVLTNSSLWTSAWCKECVNPMNFSCFVLSQGDFVSNMTCLSPVTLVPLLNTIEVQVDPPYYPTILILFYAEATLLVLLLMGVVVWRLRKGRHELPRAQAEAMSNFS